MQWVDICIDRNTFMSIVFRFCVVRMLTVQFEMVSLVRINHKHHGTAINVIVNLLNNYWSCEDLSRSIEVHVVPKHHFLQWELTEREVLWLRQTRPPVVVGVALNISLLLKCHIKVKANGYVSNTVHFINSLKHQGLL